MARASFDREGFFRALDKVRTRRRLNWKEVAGQSGVTASTLTRLSQGKGPDIDGLAALASWGGLNLNRFVKEAAHV